MKFIASQNLPSSELQIYSVPFQANVFFKFHISQSILKKKSTPPKWVILGEQEKVKKEKSCERCFEKGKNRSAINCVVLRKTNSEKVYNLE